MLHAVSFKMTVSPPSCFRVYLSHHTAVAIPFERLQHSRRLGNSSRGTGDVEPLVNGRVDGGGGLFLALGDVEGGGVDAVVAVGDRGVGTVILVSR